MIFSVTLTYTRPIEEVNQHLDTHKAWLAGNLRHGHVILAGPLEGGGGGLVLAVCEDRAELEAMMAQDSFIANEVASYQAWACTPALASIQFPVQWAPDAKLI
jgi:uncharacterized protein YciI